MAYSSWDCDCYQCDAERATPLMTETREEEPMTKLLTCNCASRYVRDAEHEGDCDLWLIDEFWAGFLAWDWERECLVPTPKNPEYVQMQLRADEEDGYEWVNDYLAQKDARQYGVEGMSNAQLGMKDEDIILTTDAFIDRMLSNNTSGVEDDGAWIKNSEGMWQKTEKYPSGATSTTYQYADPYMSDSLDWNNYMSDRHTQTPVYMPDGETVVHCTSLSKAASCEVVPDFALYMDSAWRADGLAIMLPWRDYGLPDVSYAFADYAIKEAWSWAKAGAFVELGCIGAHGRTGAVLACMAILADPELQPGEAVAFVRTAYCDHAIETREQEWFVARFHADHHGIPAPDMPPKPVNKPAPVSTGTTPLTSGSTTAGSPSGGPLGDPERKRGKARRSKRGGKRVQKHRNRMAQGSRP